MSTIDVKSISKKIKKSIAKEVVVIKSKGLRPPHLSAIMVGANPASQAYVGNKIKTCKELGFESSLYHFEEEVTQKEIEDCIERLNNDDSVDGFILQLPLPRHLDPQELLMKIDYKKDVDGFHPMNFGKMALGLPSYLPATPYGIMMLIEDLQLDLSGKRVAILGRSDIVGTPMALLLSRKGKYSNATITLLHSRSQNLNEELRRAEVIIAAIGAPNFIKADMVSDGVVVFDVGINRVVDEAGQARLVGDVDFEQVSTKASLITPVPGGIGLMTIVGLMKNTLTSYQERNK